MNERQIEKYFFLYGLKLKGLSSGVRRTYACYKSVI